MYRWQSADSPTTKDERSQQAAKHIQNTHDGFTMISLKVRECCLLSGWAGPVQQPSLLKMEITNASEPKCGTCRQTMRQCKRSIADPSYKKHTDVWLKTRRADESGAIPDERLYWEKNPKMSTCGEFIALEDKRINTSWNLGSGEVCVHKIAAQLQIHFNFHIRRRIWADDIKNKWRSL